MITDILIVLGAIAVVILVLYTAAWAVQREPAGHGQHGARREHRPWHLWPLVLKVRRDHPRNIVARLRAGEGWRDALAARWAPPMARTLRPLPPQREVYPRDAVDDLIDAMNLPGPALGEPLAHLAAQGNGEQHRAGEPTWDAHAYWQPNRKTITDVLPPRVVAALNGARSDDTIVTRRDRQAWLDELVGGDPFEGLGQDEWLDRLFYRPLAVTGG